MCIFNTLFEIVNICALFQVTELFLNSLDLLIQVILALAFFHLAFDTATDALFHLENIDFAFHQAHQVFQTAPYRKHLKYFLFLLQLERQMRGNGIGQTPSLIDTHQ